MIKNKIYNYLRKVYLYATYKAPYCIARAFFRVDNNTICLESWNGSSFNCNPKALALYLAKHSEKLNICVLVNKPERYQDRFPGISFYKKNKFNQLKLYSVCKIYITNVRNEYFNKKKEQFYIQTWHGVGPKKSEKDTISVLTNIYIKKAQKDCAQTDLMVSNCKYQTNWIKNSTWYDGKVVETGMPRSDIFFDKEQQTKLKTSIFNRYHIKEQSKILLYAPSFRGIKEITQFGFSCSELSKRLKNKFGGSWVILLRFHPNVANQKVPDIFNGQDIINVTDYDDMQDLLCISDILITDFSSTSTEFAIQSKPCFLYAPDFKDYDRGLYLSPNDMPFPFSSSECELYDTIDAFNENIYADKTLTYKKSLGMMEDGKACERLFDILKSNYLNNEY